MPLDAQRTDRYLRIGQPIEFFDKSVSQFIDRIFQSLVLPAMLCHTVFIQKVVSTGFDPFSQNWTDDWYPFDNSTSKIRCSVQDLVLYRFLLVLQFMQRVPVLLERFL